MSFSFLSGAVKTTNTNFTVDGYILPSEVEKGLGNPSANGQLLASNTDGVRYWTSNISADTLRVETLIANGVIGNAGQALISDGQNVYWSDSTGYVGSQGLQGVQGATGFVGSQGLQGVQGAQGAQGFQGVIGAQGAPGDQGVQGAVGAKVHPASLVRKDCKVLKELLELKVFKVTKVYKELKASKVRKVFKVRKAQLVS